MKIDTYGGRGLIPIGAGLYRDSKHHLAQVGTDVSSCGWPRHPLTLSLTHEAAEALGTDEWEGDSRRWRLTAQYDKEAHGPNLANLIVPVEVEQI